jgi:FtsP/CotA-like multicopper oxidase with cupredoxin domain
MADMEAGLFSGYNAKQNNVPTIDSWRFVTAVVDGGGGNKWDLRGGNAQQGGLTTFYSGVRPGTPASNAYFPMHKQGAILLGNGGDNGNGSAGTFYEGAMTTGFPTEATTDVVQANIVVKMGENIRIRLGNIVHNAHPIHIHGHQFAVSASDGNSIPIWNRPMKTTINVASGETYDIEFKANNPGIWPFHCHIPHHMSNNMQDPSGGMFTVIRYA